MSTPNPAAPEPRPDVGLSSPADTPAETGPALPTDTGGNLSPVTAGPVAPAVPAALAPTAPAQARIPAVVSEVRGEIAPSASDAWQPKSYAEWEARERAKTFLAAWAEQMSHERALRTFTAKWIFALIIAQVVATFGLVIAHGLGWLQINEAILQILIPSVLAEVFGLGLLVTKYLFSQPLRHGLDSLVEGARNAP